MNILQNLENILEDLEELKKKKYTDSWNGFIGQLQKDVTESYLKFIIHESQKRKKDGKEM